VAKNQLHKTDHASVSIENGKNFIFTHPAGKDINVRTIGTKRPKKTNHFPYFSNRENAVSTSDGLMKNRFPYLANQAWILSLFPRYPKK
jgi:hypothetical protein